MGSPSGVRPRAGVPREEVAADVHARKSRTLQTIGALALACSATDFVIASRGQAAVALAFRAAWCAGLVLLGHHLPRLPRVAQRTAIAGADLLSAVCWLGAVQATGGARSYLLPWSVAMPLAITLISRDSVPASLAAGSLVIAGTLVMKIVAGASGQDLFGWGTLGVASIGASALAGASLVRAARHERELMRSRIEALEMLAESERRRVAAERFATAGRMAAGVAHEVNNPLAFVKANLEMLRELCGSLDGAWPGKQEMVTLVEEAEVGAERIRRIVHDLHVINFEQPQRLVAVEVAALVARSLERARQHRGSFPEVQLDLQPVLPAVCVAEARATAALEQLILNAVDATLERRPATGLWIRISAAAEPGRVTIRVEDEGVGISPESIERLFLPFHTTKEPGKGMGLGLAVSRASVERMGGSLRGEVRPQGGMCFLLELPAASAGSVP